MEGVKIFQSTGYGRYWKLDKILILIWIRICGFDERAVGVNAHIVIIWMPWNQIRCGCDVARGLTSNQLEQGPSFFQHLFQLTASEMTWWLIVWLVTTMIKVAIMVMMLTTMLTMMMLLVSSNCVICSTNELSSDEDSRNRRPPRYLSSSMCFQNRLNVELHDAQFIGSFHLFHLALNRVHVAPDVDVKPLELVRVQFVTVKHLSIVIITFQFEFYPKTCLVLLQCGQKVLETTRRAFDAIKEVTSGTPSDLALLSWWWNSWQL